MMNDFIRDKKGFIIRYAIPLCLIVFLVMVFLLICMKVDGTPLLQIIKNYYIQ